MATFKKFEEIEAWQKCRTLSKAIFAETRQGMFARDFRLKDQINASCGSVMDNIAEGFEYDNKKDFIKFLRYSKGSTGEVRNMLNVLIRIEYINEKTYSFLYEKLTSLSKQLYGFIHYLKNFNSNN